MNSHRLRIAVAAGASALLLAACGGGDDDTSTIASQAADAAADATATVAAPSTPDEAADPAGAQQVFDVYTGAFAAGNPALACLQLTEAAKQHVADNQSATSCEEALGGLFPGLSKGWIADYEAAELGPVQVDGDTGTVTVPPAYQGGLAAPQFIVNQDGAWKLAFEAETP